MPSTGNRPDRSPGGSTVDDAETAVVRRPNPPGSWVPIRSLARRHRRHIVAHLLALESPARYLRFGYAASDEQIARYVERLDFERDEVFGIFSRGLVLIAVAHLAHAAVAPPPQAGIDTSKFGDSRFGDSKFGASEFGVSVLGESRGRGYGMRLFRHAMLHARNRGVRTLLIHALSENIRMLKIARAAGATVALDGAEADAVVTLPPDTLSSHVGEMVERRAAEWNYAIKRQARRARKLLGAITHIRRVTSPVDRTAKD